MSKLTQLFRRFMKENVDATESEILRHNNRRAKDKTGQPCTLPMNPDKAKRVAKQLHNTKKLR